MTGTARKAADVTKKAAGSSNASKRSNVKPPAKQTGARQKAPAKRPARAPKPAAPPPPAAPLASELTESAAKAVERALGLVTMTPRRAVMVASVRALAAGLDLAEAGDRPKITRELDRLMGVLMADANPIGEPPDWTEQTAAP